jgi:hypothetical protein
LCGSPPSRAAPVNVRAPGAKGADGLCRNAINRTLLAARAICAAGFLRAVHTPCPRWHDRDAWDHVCCPLLCRLLGANSSVACRGVAHQDNINRFRGRTSAAFGFAVTRFIVMRIRQGTLESRGKRCFRRAVLARGPLRRAVPLRKRPSPPRHREAAAPPVWSSRGAGLAKVETRSVPSANCGRDAHC